MQDIVELGGKLYCLSLGTAPDPALTEPLEYVDARTLRSHDPNGFGGYGEDFVFEFDTAGAAVIRGPGGMKLVRQSDFRVPSRVVNPAG